MGWTHFSPLTVLNEKSYKVTVENMRGIKNKKKAFGCNKKR